MTILTRTLGVAAVVALSYAAGTGAGQANKQVADCSGAAANRPQGASASDGRHAYFEALAARPDCLHSYSLRNQAELENIRSGARSEKKQPITYDASMDAARITINAQVSTDSQQKLLPIQVRTGSFLLTWDFRFDRNFAWGGQGDMGRHKTWRLDPGPWLAFKTDYRSASRGGHLAEFFVSTQGKRFLGPGTTRERREILAPRLTQFFIEPDRWTRVWIFAEGIDQPNAKISVWAADDRRDPVQLYDKIAMVPPAGGINLFRLEYDTSADQAKNRETAHSWNRNVVVLHNVPASDVPGLLKRPL